MLKSPVAHHRDEYSHIDQEPASRERSCCRWRNTGRKYIGNRCDCDFNNDDVVNLADVGFFTQVAGAVDTYRYPGETSENYLDLAWGEETTVDGILVTPELMDHNADGRVDVLDFNILVDGFGLGPGPSSVANAQ